MKRPPLLATLIVLAAIATMIGLGVWQLKRKGEKEALLHRYAAAQDLPEVTLSAAPKADDALLYRRVTAPCDRVTVSRVEGGQDDRGESGWVQIVGCNGSPGRPAFRAILGWSDRPPVGTSWSGGLVRGIASRDREGLLRIVAAEPPPGLRRARPPSLDNIPNNHLFYAAQWFSFAAAAAVIYVLALRRRSR